MLKIKRDSQLPELTYNWQENTQIGELKEHKQEINKVNKVDVA